MGCAMPDFWKLSGYHLLDRREDGMLGVSDDFLRAYYLRPEMQPETGSCAAERALHDALLDNPRRPVSPDDIAAIGDPDARANYSAVVGFRDRLLDAGTVEGCYLRLFASGVGGTPPLFIDQMAHVILRNILDGCEDPVRLRAAELFFRTQKVSLRDGAVLMADEETIDMKRETAGLGNIGRLLMEMEPPLDRVDLDVLGPANAGQYWARCDRYDLVFDASFGQPGLSGLCRVIEAWVAHMLAIETSVVPVREIQDERWVWHIGLDSEATALLNALYEGGELGEDRLRRLLALFRLEFSGDVPLRPEIAGHPVYLALAMDGEKIVRLKPQNLLVNMPTVPVA